MLHNHKYRSAALIIPMFVDIVSKNGNLLLNIPLPGPGEPDSDEIAFLDEMAVWQGINGKAIKGTRPWTIYGEGPSTQARKIKAYQFDQLKFDHRDIRFTSKGEILYAFALGWPTEGGLVITSLAAGTENYKREIGRIDLLGSDRPLRWTRDAGGLVIDLPPQRPCDYAYAFRIVPA